MRSILLVLFLILCSCSEKINNEQILPDNPNDIRPLKIGDKIPNFKLIDLKGNEFYLYDYLKNKPTILIVFRGGWCLYCNIHLGKIHEIEQDLFDLGFQILAISADLKDKSSELSKKLNIKYDLVRDPDLQGTLSLGLVYNAEKLYSDMLNVLENYSGSKKHLLPVPAAFIVDKNAIIHFEYINPNHKVRIHPDILLAAAKVFVKDSL